jgi:hypothetical protein
MKKYLLIVLLLSACATFENTSFDIMELDDRCLVYDNNGDSITPSSISIKQLIGKGKAIVNVCFYDGDCDYDKDYYMVIDWLSADELVDNEVYEAIPWKNKDIICFIKDKGTYSYKTITGAKRTISKLSYIKNAKNVISKKTGLEIEELKKKGKNIEYLGG